MSDFFNNLIARSYDLKPVARPRLASRFEPQPGSPLLNESQAPALETEEFERSDEATEARAQSEREPDRQQAFKSSQTEETQPPHTTQETRLIVSRSVETESRQPQAKLSSDAANSSLLSETDAHVIARSLTQNPSSSVSESSVEHSAHDLRARHAASSHSFKDKDTEGASVNQTKELEKEAAPHAQDNPLSRSGQSFKDALALNEAQPSSNLSSSDGQDTERTRRSVAPAKVSAQSNAKDEAAAAVSVESRSVDANANSSPVIRVTIGRVDVRAIMPDSKGARPPSQPARQTHQPLSLEEYLKQRNGGGR